MAIEVELTRKGRRQLNPICLGWARARHLDAVYYLAAPRVATTVGRAARETGADDRVRVLGLRQVGEVIACERNPTS